MQGFEQWRENPSAQFQSAPAPLSHSALPHLVAGLSIQSYGANTPSSSLTPAGSSVSQVASNDVYTHSETGTKGLLERYKQVVAPISSPASVGSSQSRDLPDVANVLSTEVAGASVNVVLPFNGIYRLSPELVGVS